MRLSTFEISVKPLRPVSDRACVAEGPLLFNTSKVLAEELRSSVENSLRASGCF